MNEYELLYLIHEKTSTFWSLFQFWAGVTFAYIATTHFAAKHLNAFIIIFLSIIYSCMFFHVLQLMGENTALITALIEDLRNLVASSESLTGTAKIQLERSDALIFWPIIIAIFGSFIGSLIYLPYMRFWSGNENT